MAKAVPDPWVYADTPEALMTRAVLLPRAGGSYVPPWSDVHYAKLLAPMIAARLFANVVEVHYEIFLAATPLSMYWRPRNYPARLHVLGRVAEEPALVAAAERLALCTHAELATMTAKMVAARCAPEE